VLAPEVLPPEVLLPEVLALDELEGGVTGAGVDSSAEVDEQLFPRDEFRLHAQFLYHAKPEATRERQTKRRIINILLSSSAITISIQN
jgi:hypothetical protein